MIDVSDPFNSDNSEQELSQSSSLGSPGAILKEARIKAGLSQETVADELNLVVARVDALETDRYEKLASDVFALGYLRRYSKLVGVDEELIAERFREWRADNQPQTAQTEVRRRSRSPSPAGLLVAVLLVIIAAVAAFFYFRTADAPTTTPAPARELPQRQAPADAPEADDPAVVPNSGDDLYWDEDELGNGNEVADSATPDLDSLDQPVAEPSQALNNGWDDENLNAQDSSTADTSAFTGLAESSSDEASSEEAENAELNFSFTDECWVEVRDGSGRVLRAEVANAGQSMTVEGEAPFSVMLGNARAASVRYNGEPVAVNTRPGNRTARLTVGP